VKISIITPAYSKHLRLLDLSAESVDRNCPPEMHHYVIVSRQEERIFRHLNGSRRSVIAAEDVIPGNIMRLPVFIRGREVWVADWHRFVRGWIMQQAIKLSAPEITDADVFLFLDTDSFFVRPFTPDRVSRDGRIRLLGFPGLAQTEQHKSWHRTAAKLLGIPSRDYFGADFIGNAITWRRDVCLEMRKRISSVAGADWFSTIVRQQRLSEYILYGVFVQEVLGSADSRHALTSEELCLSSWDNSSAQRVAERLAPHHVAVNIQSNLHLPISEFRVLLDRVVAAAGTKS
jgi:Family of unknown function (DUF6492)